jgi:hypothetical protein
MHFSLEKLSLITLISELLELYAILLIMPWSKTREGEEDVAIADPRDFFQWPEHIQTYVLRM